MRILAAIVCTLIACSTTQVAQKASPLEPKPTAMDSQYNNITRDQLAEMFHNMQHKAGWDLSKDMVWGYYFTHQEASAFASLRPELERLGYRIVDVYQSDDGGIYFLHAERIETHSVDSLHQRNNELADLAFSRGVTYDGMDVGPQPQRE